MQECRERIRENIVKMLYSEQQKPKQIQIKRCSREKTLKKEKEKIEDENVCDPRQAAATLPVI